MLHCYHTVVTLLSHCCYTAKAVKNYEVMRRHPLALHTHTYIHMNDEVMRRQTVALHTHMYIQIHTHTHTHTHTYFRR